MSNKAVDKILAKLDRTAGTLENLKKGNKIDVQAADELINNIDSFADKLEIAAYGEKNLRNRQAKVIRQDNDEPYMKTYDNPNKIIQSDADEPYMHSTPASFNHKSMKSYDQDSTVTVSERDEYDVRDVSEWADGTKPQPSWNGGSAGKSTRQGATKPEQKSEKTWA